MGCAGPSENYAAAPKDAAPARACRRAIAAVLRQAWPRCGSDAGLFLERLLDHGADLVVEAWIEGAGLLIGSCRVFCISSTRPARRVGVFERDDLEERGAEPEDIGFGAYALRIAA
jgi:hypothetical protein